MVVTSILWGTLLVNSLSLLMRGEGSERSPCQGRSRSVQPCPFTPQVAAKALETGMFGAYFNVLINLKDISDDKFKDQVSSRRGLQVAQGAGPPGKSLSDETVVQPLAWMRPGRPATPGNSCCPRSGCLWWHQLFPAAGALTPLAGGQGSCRPWGPCALPGAAARPP